MLPVDPPTWRIPFLRGVAIEDYKSIGKSFVHLGPLTVLVGRNGSGKSNFLDALRFIGDSLQTSLDHAIRSRGITRGISRRGAEFPVFVIHLELELADKRLAFYVIVVAVSSRGEFQISSEALNILSASRELLCFYRVGGGKVIGSSIGQPPPAQRDRLYLVSASGFPEFRPVYDAFAAMKFYDFNADVMKKPQSPDVGGWLRPDGSNVASVVARLSTEQPEALRRITQYLSTIVPGIVSIERVSLGPVETLKFMQRGSYSAKPDEFFAWSMSDGTLRALGSLVAVSQSSIQGESASLVGIEEPETSLHPAATAALMDGLREATEHTQVIITSHSPDLLDQMDLETDTLLAVALQDGVTRIAPIDKASRSVIRDHLYTPGELLRLDQLEPDQEDLARQESAESRSEEKED
jgi:predicted ATPase